MTQRRLWLALLVVLVAGITGCGRRSRGTPPLPPAHEGSLPADRDSVQTPEAKPTTLAVGETSAAWPPSPPPGLEAVAATETAAATIPLNPLWDDLDEALDGLDWALAGIEAWEVAVP
ncbi:MAG: hypothetical protein MUO23_06740 [Anaerolineales bacterium]|nr:hypothetical protein [Anaerolineales bacterium]